MIVMSNASITEHVVVLHNVRDELFRAMLEIVEDDGHARLNYDRGTLEVMTPSGDHEICARLIDKFLGAISEHLNADVDHFGSTTLRIEHGSGEPDSCYYIEHAAAIRGNTDIDLALVPPPDLVVEIDLSHERMEKRELYARMGVPEFWRYDGAKIFAYRLTDGRYETSATSVAFPWLEVAKIGEFLARRRAEGQLAILRSFRAYLGENAL